MSRVNNQKVEPVVSVYQYTEDDTLVVKKYAEANEDWLNMILKCRSDHTYSHHYDIVIGKIANDRVGETVSFVMQGIMRKEDAIARLKFQKINNQIAFCSDISLEKIRFIRSYIPDYS